jgi:alcohol dehydrogenase (cytochrome c)
MKKLLLPLFCWCALAQAQTAQDLLTDGRNTENITTYGMGYDLKRYSPLKQINTGNVKRLVPVWSTSLANDLGEQAQPMIFDGVMYVTNVKWTFAIDLATGKQIWRTPVDYDPGTPRVVCCGISNKGAAIYNGRLYRVTLDAHVLALDMKTGKQLWKTKFAEWKDGYSSIVAPLVANGVLITGMSGAEFGVRGFLDAWDPETGKNLWRRYTVPGPGETGAETWPSETDVYKRGGGSTWVTGSYDPELDLTYWGTGNAAPWNTRYRGKDSLFTASVVAVRPKTGEIVWHYQFTPDDSFDYDGVNENVLADMRVDGDMRKVLLHADRNGFFYVIDRTNGKLLRGFPFGKINWASHIDMQTGRPVETDVRKRLIAGEEVELWPAFGVKNWAPMSFNPKTGMVYMNTINFPQMMKLVPIDYKAGQRYTGALHGRREPRISARGRRRCRRISGRARPAHRQIQVAEQAYGFRLAIGHALDRRRTRVHRPHDRRIPGPGRSNGQSVVAVSDRLGRQFAAGHLHLQRAPVRHRIIGTGGRFPRAQGGRNRARRRRRVDVRADAGLRGAVR